jgi:GNAT superfamily N-acetyltransferase
MPSASIHVRKGVTEDNQRIAALGRRTFLDSFGADNHPQDMQMYLKRAFNPSTQAAELADPASCFLIAESGSHPVGYARLIASPAPACVPAPSGIRLQRLYADKAWIGNGVGAALMAACITEARRRRSAGIWLGVWAQNRRAIRFYRRWGFRHIGTQPFLLGNDHQTDQVMWLPLGSFADG